MQMASQQDGPGTTPVWVTTLAQADGSGTLVTPANPGVAPVTGTPSAGPVTTTAPATMGTPAGTPAGSPAGGTPSSPFGGTGFLLIMAGFLLIMILSSVFGQRKEKKKREELINSIGKHDEVQMVGGIIGRVAEIRDNEIVLVIDENAKTRMRFVRSAVQQVVKSVPRSGPSDGKEPTIEVKAKAEGAKV